MKPWKVIANRNLPARLPVLSTAVTWLLCDRLRTPEWVQGAVWSVMGLVWLCAVYSIAKQESVDVFQ